MTVLARRGAAIDTVPFVLLALLVAAFPWDDALAYPTKTVSVIKLLGALVAAGYLAHAVARRDELRLPWTVFAVTAFVIVMLVSLVLSGDPGSGLNRALRYVLFGGFFFLVVQLVRSRSRIVWLFRVLTVSATVAGIVGLVGIATGHVLRASGPIGEANDFAALLGATVPLALYLAVSERGRRWLWIACAAVLTVALAGTISRGAAVGLAAVGIWAVAARRVPLVPALITVGAAAAAAAVAFLLFQPFITDRLHGKSNVARENVESRKAYWSAAVRIAADHPGVGIGPGRFGIVGEQGYIHGDPLHLRRPSAHNTYLEVLAEGGAAGLLAFLAFIVGTWRLAARARRAALRDADSDSAALGSALQAGLLFSLVSALFLSTQVGAPLWLLGGLAAVLAYDVGAEEGLQFGG